METGKLGALALILFSFIVIISPAYGAETQTVISKVNEFRIDFLRTDPSPVQQGGKTDVWFELINLGEEELANFTIALVADFPFSIREGAPEKLEFDKVGAGEKISFKFSILTNSFAEDGQYKLNIQYFSEKLGAITSEPFDIVVRRANQVLAPTVVTLEPEQVEPGGIAQIKIRIANTAKSTMEDITVRLNTSGEIPIAPKGATTERHLPEIKAGQSAEVIFEVLALPDADAGVHKIPITITFFDELGNKVEKEDLIAIKIGATPELILSLGETNIFSTGPGDVTVRIVNKGLTDAKFLTITLLEPELGEYNVLSANEVYIGDLDSDDEDTADFKIRVNEKEIKLRFSVDYRDANNKPFSETQIIEMKVRSARELGVQEPIPLSLVGLIAIILVIIYLHFRGWKRKNADKTFSDYLRQLGGLRQRK